MAKKLTEDVLKKENEKLSGAYMNKNGKFVIKETYPPDEGGMHYIVSKEFKLTRLVSEFAKNLIDDGKAILIHRDEWETFKISAIKNNF